MINKKYVFWCTVSSAIGDSIVYIPVFREIKQLYPESKIIIITGSLLWLNIYRECKYIDEIIIFNNNSKLYQKIFNTLKVINSWINFYLDFNWDKISFIIWLLSLSYKKICFDTNKFKLFYKYITDTIILNNIYNWEPSLINLYQNILFWYGNKLINNDYLELTTQKNINEQNKFKIDKDYIVIHFWWMERNLWNKWINIRCWPTENWINLLNKILTVNNNIIIAFIGWKDNIDPVNEIVNNLKTANVINYVNKLTIIETVEIIRNCSVFIWTDSWPIHIAAALQKNIIWIIWWWMHNINKYISNIIQKDNVLDITTEEVFNEYKKIIEL